MCKFAWELNLLSLMVLRNVVFNLLILLKLSAVQVDTGYVNNVITYKWINESLYIWAAENDTKAMIDHHSYAYNLSSCEIKAWKNSSLDGIRTHALHTAGAREIWIDQSGFSRREKLYCPDVKLTRQERHWNQATFLTGNGFKYVHEKGIYNFKNHTRLQKVKNMKHFESPSF